MPLMRSVFYVPSNNERMVAKAAGIKADVLTLDLEDSVPPAEKIGGREKIRGYFKTGRGTQRSSCLYVRINGWETHMTSDDLEAVVYQGLDGVCLAKCDNSEGVQRLDGKLEELERKRGMEVGTVAVQLLIETAKGVINAYAAATASPRVNSLIFGAVDFTKDMRIRPTPEGDEQFYARSHIAVVARAAGCVAIDGPFVTYADREGFEKSTRQGRQMGYEGRVLIHPSQIEPAHGIYTPSRGDVKWAEEVKKIFDEEGIAKGIGVVSYKGKMIDKPVYDDAVTILAAVKEIAEAETESE